MATMDQGRRRPRIQMVDVLRQSLETGVKSGLTEPPILC
jgi:hypothetical protein